MKGAVPTNGHWPIVLIPSYSLDGETVRHEAARAGLEWMGLPMKDLAGRGRWLDEKAVLASLIPGRTGVRNAWVADRLGMGTEGNVTRALRRLREDGRLGRKLKQCERMLEKRDRPL